MKLRLTSPSAREAVELSPLRNCTSCSRVRSPTRCPLDALAFVGLESKQLRLYRHSQRRNLSFTFRTARMSHR